MGGKTVEIWNRLLYLIYPDYCIHCNEIVPFNHPRGVCETCEVEAPYVKGHLCLICGQPIEGNVADLCHDCSRRHHYFEQGRAIWSYEGAIRDAIHRFKYKKQRSNGLLFAKEMAWYYNKSIEWPINIVMGVPLHPKKRRERGFNQTEEVGQAFAKLIRVPFQKDGLSRVLNTKSQMRLSDQDRMKNMKQAFKADHHLVKGKSILLIDDVYTTGATLDGCAKALLQAGAKEVYFMTLAIGRGYS